MSLAYCGHGAIGLRQNDTPMSTPYECPSCGYKLDRDERLTECPMCNAALQPGAVPSLCPVAEGD